MSKIKIVKNVLKILLAVLILAAIYNTCEENSEEDNFETADVQPYEQGPQQAVYLDVDSFLSANPLIIEQ